MKLLNQLDEYFYSKSSKKEFYYAIVMIVFLLGFIIYYYIFPIAQSFEENSVKHYNKLNTDIRNLQMRVNILNAKKMRLKKDYQSFNKKLKNLNKEALFIEELVKLLDFVKFNEYKWASYVKKAVFNAKNEGLKVEIIQNKLLNDTNKSKIQPKAEITLELNGNYLNFIHFIYINESLKDLIRVKEMNIKDKHNFDVTFVLYGYEQ